MTTAPKRQRRGAHRGVRWIKGQEYLLAGRFSTRESGLEAATHYQKRGGLTKVIKLGFMDFALYTHGGLS